MVAKFPLSMIISDHCQVRSSDFTYQYFPFPPSERATKSCFCQKRKVRVTKLGELSCDIQNISIENNLWYHSLVSSIFLLSQALSPSFPYKDPLGSSSYVVVATDYISAGLVCTCQVFVLEFKQFNGLISFFSTCQELNVLSLFYVHRWPLLRDGSLFFLNQCSVFLFSPLQGILFHPTKETYRRAWHHKQGWLAPHSEAILTIWGC